MAKIENLPATRGTASIPDDARTIGSLLRAAYDGLSARLYGGLEKAGYDGVRPAHSAVIRHLPENGARLTDLAARACIAKQSMAYLVAHLEAHGYLEVRPDPEDARARLVRLSKRGKRLATAMVERSRELEEEAAARLGRKEMEHLRSHLETLGSIWGEG